MLPESVVRDHLRGKLLVALPLEIGKSLAGFGILTRKGEALAEPALRFIDLLRGFSRTLARDGDDLATLCAPDSLIAPDPVH
jgi:DNA-binding transcriptional LysR family regulator